jgi:putative ABC transport system ATP-binding protein
VVHTSVLIKLGKTFIKRQALRIRLINNMNCRNSVQLNFIHNYQLSTVNYQLKRKENHKKMGSFVELKNVKKSYDMGEVVITAVDDVSFSIDKGEFVIVLGASGAGKSTILNLLGGMDYVTEGSIFVDGNEISKYDKKLLTKYRREDIGFVFQFYNLVQNLNAVENVELAVELCKDSMKPEEVLRNVGLGDRLNNFPSQLSGGEQQRVSIARAIAKNPKLLLCDEPTGALDYNTGKAILKLLSDTAKMYNMTVVVITHNSAIAPIADKIITVKSGKIASVKKNENPAPIESIEW